MICYKTQSLFVHIPKAAGQSIEQVFVEHNGLTWKQRAPLLLRPNDDPAMGPPRLAHLTAEEYVRCGHISQSQFEQLFKFSFVRNPWGRLYSEYRYRRSHGDSDYQVAFKRFLFEGMPSESKDNYKTHKDYYRHILPQYQFLYSKTGDCLVDFVGKFENISEDFSFIARKLNLPRPFLSHKNKTGSKRRVFKDWFLANDYRKAYDNEMIDYVSQRYHKDILSFDYSFE